MSLNLKVLQLSDLEEILDFEKKKLSESISDEMEREFAAWNGRWRREALEHYLPMGWSFLARDHDSQIIGYFIAQPLLFLDGQTQSLWVEHLQFSSLQARDELCELAYKLAKEKHLQKVYFPQQNTIENAVKALKAETWSPGVLHIKTTKA